MRRIAIALLVGLLLLACASAAFADEKGIKSISVWAKLNEDGSADITEVWEIEDVYKGTEYYKALNSVGRNTVSNLTVTDDRGVSYTFLDHWDTDASFEEKAGKCGINTTDEGYEICWGISEMGNRKYTVSYVLAGLVKHYSDYDGFYYVFISDGMFSAPEYAQVNVSIDGVELSEANSRIWAFGYAGDIHFVNGGIVARSNKPLRKRDYVNLLVSFDHGIFDAPNGSGTFAQIQDRAINKKTFARSTVISVAAVIAALVALICIWVSRHAKYIHLADDTVLLRANEKTVEISNKPTLGGSIAETRALMKLGSAFGETGIVITGYMIQWITSGAARLEGEDENATLILKGTLKGERPAVELYDMFVAASDFGRLPLKVWQEWLEMHEREFSQWRESMEAFGERQLEAAGLSGKDAKGKLRLTRAGHEVYREALGYKLYLKQIASLKASAPLTEEDWKQALTFAAYYGLAKEIAPSFDAVDRDNFSDDYRYMSYGSYLYATRCGSSFSSSPSSGSGGSSFSSGGGGASGGGGGGSR